MEYYKLLGLLQENMYPDCWTNSADHEGLYIYTSKENVSVSIVELPDEEDNKAENEFTERFVNESAYFHRYALKYNGSIVKVFAFLSVDGGRAIIPAPKIIDENYVHDDHVIINVIIDRLIHQGRYEHDDTINYLEKAKLAFQKSIIQ